jgi:hypothetical protein
VPVISATSSVWKGLFTLAAPLRPPTYYCLDKKGVNILSFYNGNDPLFGCRCDVSDSWAKADFVSFVSGRSDLVCHWPEVVLVDSIV